MLEESTISNIISNTPEKLNSFRPSVGSYLIKEIDSKTWEYSDGLETHDASSLIEALAKLKILVKENHNVEITKDNIKIIKLIKPFEINGNKLRLQISKGFLYLDFSDILMIEERKNTTLVFLRSGRVYKTPAKDIGQIFYGKGN